MKIKTYQLIFLLFLITGMENKTVKLEKPNKIKKSKIIYNY